MPELAGELDALLAKLVEHHAPLIEEMGSGSTVKGISVGDLKSIEFRFPSPEGQAAIVAVLSEMDAEICALEARLAKTHTLKQGMMQELLTGRIRLVELQPYFRGREMEVGIRTVPE